MKKPNGPSLPPGRAHLIVDPRSYVVVEARGRRFRLLKTKAEIFSTGILLMLFAADLPGVDAILRQFGIALLDDETGQQAVLVPTEAEGGQEVGP